MYMQKNELVLLFWTQIEHIYTHACFMHRCTSVYLRVYFLFAYPFPFNWILILWHSGGQNYDFCEIVTSGTWQISRIIEVPDLNQLILPDHLTNMMFITIRHVVRDNCRFEPLSSPTSVTLKDHTPLYQLQLALRAVTIMNWFISGNLKYHDSAHQPSAIYVDLFLLYRERNPTELNL